METPSEVIERYRKWDIDNPWKQKTREQLEELLAAVKERKKELTQIINNK